MKLQICLLHGIVCVYLKNYVNKRQEYFDLIVDIYGCTEEDAKVLFIILLYGGCINDWVFKNKIDIKKIQKKYVGFNEVLECPDITAFRLEQEAMNQIIMDKNPHLKETIIKVINNVLLVN